jgi:hypothetical protein
MGHDERSEVLPQAKTIGIPAHRSDKPPRAGETLAASRPEPRRVAISMIHACGLPLARIGHMNFSAACAGPRSGTHHLADAYLLRYAQEASWREDNRRASNGEQVNRLAGLPMKHKPSVDFSSYWQRHVVEA